MTAAPTPPKAMPKWQQTLLKGLWEDTIKPKLVAALKGLPAKDLAAITAVVGAIDALLLKGPPPLPANITGVLTGLRQLIDRILAPPKPLSAKLRKVLAAVVTLAGMLGVYQAGKATAAKP